MARRMSTFEGFALTSESFAKKNGPQEYGQARGF